MPTTAQNAVFESIKHRFADGLHPLTGPHIIGIGLTRWEAANPSEPKLTTEDYMAVEAMVFEMAGFPPETQAEIRAISGK